MKRNVVYVKHNGSNVYLDVDRVIAVDPNKQTIYFEGVIWILDEKDYMKVFEAWMQ